MRGGFGPVLLRIDGVALAAYNVAVKCILYVRRAVRDVVKLRAIGLIFGEEKFEWALKKQPALSVVILGDFDNRCSGEAHDARRARSIVRIAPIPPIAKP